MNKTERWMARRPQLVALVLTTTVAALSGLYINILTNTADKPGVSGGLEVFWQTGSWNLIVVVSVALVWLQYQVSTSASRQVSANADDLIKRILESAARTLVFPNIEANLRGFVKLIDPDGQKLRVRYSYHATPDPDRLISYPVNFGVSGRAWATRHAVYEELREDHIEGYSPDIRGQIPPRLRTVIAAPLMVSMDARIPPLGVLTFDSTLTPARLGFDKPEARELVQYWADVIAVLVSLGVNSNAD